MSLDEQVLAIAFFVVALKLFLWSWEEDVVGVDDHSGLRLPEGARPDGAEGIAATPLRPGWIGDRYV